jgi:hypothetical protein
MSKAEPLLVAVSEASPAGALLVELGIGLRFRCQNIEHSHPYYLSVQVEWSPKEGDEKTVVDLMIPHRDVTLIAMNAPARMMGFHVDRG